MVDGQTVQMAFFAGGIGAPEWIIILVVMLLLFGRRLPDVMRNLGSSARQFRKGLEDDKDAIGSQASVEGTQPKPSVADSQAPNGEADKKQDA